MCCLVPKHIPWCNGFYLQTTQLIKSNQSSYALCFTAIPTSSPPKLAKPVPSLTSIQQGETSYDWFHLQFPVCFLQWCSSREIYIQSKINIKCQAYVLGYTTENKLLNCQKTMCQWLNVRQSVHRAVFMSNPLDHRQHSAPL